MTTIPVQKANALKAYREADNKGKELLSNLLGKEHFGSIIDRVKTFEDACAETGEDPSDAKFNNGTPDVVAFEKLKVIAKALREGVVLSYANHNQKKWYPYFFWPEGGSGFRFDGSGYDYTDTYSGGGSRLCVDTEEKANYIGKQFIDLYNQFLN